jgi:hypothetical protein
MGWFRTQGKVLLQSTIILKQCMLFFFGPVPEGAELPCWCSGLYLGMLIHSGLCRCIFKAHASGHCQSERHFRIPKLADLTLLDRTQWFPDPKQSPAGHSWQGQINQPHPYGRPSLPIILPLEGGLRSLQADLRCSKALSKRCCRTLLKSTWEISSWREKSQVKNKKT